MVAIVVVTFNRLSLLKDLIVSLKEQQYSDNKIIVVNNGSTDGTTEWLAEQQGLVVINQDNVGGAGGFFTGMKYAAENEDFDYCWVMDDDVLCPPDALTELINAAHADPSAGFVCSRVVSEDDEDLNVPIPAYLRRGHPYPLTFSHVASDAMVEVERATFVSVLIPVANIRKFGLPLREFFIWGDDTEYTLRLSSSMPCYIACRSKVTHRRQNKGGLDFLTEQNPRRLKMYYYFYRNCFVYTRRWNTKRFAVAKLALEQLILLAKLLLKFDFKRFRILASATWAGLWFNPKTLFPNGLNAPDQNV